MARARTRNSIPPQMPDLDGPHQPGITDPQWPPEPPAQAAISARDYAIEYAGRVDRQHFMALAVADLVGVSDRGALIEVLRAVSKEVDSQMRKRPSEEHLPPLALLPDSYRVTITVGFGWKLFRDAQGDDRFGIDGQRPRQLKPMPRLPGDAAGLAPDEQAGDLTFVVSSDHPYINVAIVRALAHGYVHAALRVKQIEQGFGRPDKREFLRFDDGIENLSNSTPERDLDRLVYVQAGDDEPPWCVGGSYLVYRKIRENLPVWEHLDPNPVVREKLQEQMIGREKKSGLPLSRERTGPGKLTPVYPDPADDADGRLNAHIRKVQPRRPGPDMFGGSDLDRRFLRRPYPYFEGLDASGLVSCGLHFLAYMRSLRKQFEWVAQMWQMNPDFPVPGTGIDALYARGIFATVGGGYYFCPPAARGKDAFLGAGMFGEA
jgi:deferrochelatase/peroxidase EfeB